MSTSNQMATNQLPKQPTHLGEKRSNFYAHPLSPRLWRALAFALLLATITISSAGAASLDRPVDAAQRQAPPVGEPYLVKDVNAAAPRQLNPKGLIKIDGVLYFSGDLWPSGEGLWRSDGTSEGTILLKRNTPTQRIGNKIEADGLLFFNVGDELWKTDGTLAGTQLVKKLPQLAEKQEIIRQIINVNGTLYLEFGPYQLWKSDGTPAGTVLVKEVDPDDPKTWLSFYKTYLPVGDTLFFSARTSEQSAELWKSDGTTEGTVLVKAFESNLGSRFTVRDLININGKLFFFAGPEGYTKHELWTSDGTTDGTERLATGFRAPWNADVSLLNFNNTLVFRLGKLWRSDGTVEGTYPLVNPVADETYRASNSLPVVAGEHIYFIRGKTDNTANELWKSDGTPEGTVRLKDINSGRLTEFNGKLYFFSPDADGQKFWTSDGTHEGTELLQEVPLRLGANPILSSLLTANDMLYFFARYETDYTLWRSDGTAAGTTQIDTLFQSENQRFLANFTFLGDKIIFGTAKREFEGNTARSINGDLWVTDGTVDGTSQIVVGSDDSNPSKFVAVNGTIYFAAVDGIHGGQQLWKTDGTEAGTSLVAAVNELPIAPLYGFQNISNTLFLRVPNNGSFNLWSSDGTEAGTEPFLDPPEDDPYSVAPTELWRVGDSFLFFNSPYYRDGSLWKTDGTKAGTSLVTNVGSNSAVTTGERLFFVHADNAKGKELWTSDGTPEGTKLVKDIYFGSRDSCVEQMTVINGMLFFTATDGIHGAELWKSDGTPEGTVMVKDIVPGPKYGELIEFTDVDGTLYFQAGDETNGFELWKSDGTEAGTILIKDINEGRNNSSPENLTNIDGVLYFSADDGIHGRELWKSDGTGDGTVLVQDIVPGEATSEPTDITNGNGLIYFSADDGIHGRELWQSNGTPDGTIMVADIHVGEASALPKRWYTAGDTLYTAGDILYTAGDRLYFSATDFEHGKELWAVPLDPDTDGDGEVYGSDNCPAIANAEQIDTDGDGFGDACDSDDDGDGAADVFDAFALDASETIDSDNDGIGDNTDLDDDNDTVDDGADNCPTVANLQQADRDTDGVGDACDQNNSGIYMPFVAAAVSG